MSKITFKGNPVNTGGNLPGVSSEAPDFSLVKTDLSELKLSDLKGKNVVLNIFPSLDTGVCAASVRRFNKELRLGFLSTSSNGGQINSAVFVFNCRI